MKLQDTKVFFYPPDTIGPEIGWVKLVDNSHFPLTGWCPYASPLCAMATDDIE